MAKKIRLQILDEDFHLNVTPQYLRKYLYQEQGQSYLKYENEVVPLFLPYSDLLKAIEAAERG